jgi:hypothetical protein
MILVIGMDGSVAEHKMPVNFLKFCYKEIDCSLITRVRLTADTDLWVDDEGMYTQDINPWITKIANVYGYPADYLFGVGVITGTAWTDDGPEAGNIDEKEIEKVKDILNYW